MALPFCASPAQAELGLMGLVFADPFPAQMSRNMVVLARCRKKQHHDLLQHDHSDLLQHELPVQLSCSSVGHCEGILLKEIFAT